MSFKIKIKTQPSPFGTSPETSEKKNLLDFEIHQKLERFPTLDHLTWDVVKGGILKLDKWFIFFICNIILISINNPQERSLQKSNFSIYHLQKNTFKFALLPILSFFHT